VILGNSKGRKLMMQWTFKPLVAGSVNRWRSIPAALALLSPPKNTLSYVSWIEFLILGAIN